MSSHKTKLKGEKLYRDKEILCRETIKSNKKEILSQQAFMSRHTIQVFKLQGTKVCRYTRHLCCDNYKTNSVELCRDTFKVCRDIIQ